MNQPRLIIIGAQKAGTAWLASQLFQHPNLHNPGVKEIHFFNTLQNDKKEISEIFRKRLKRVCKFFNKNELNKLLKKKYFDLDDYFYLFSKAKQDQICWEATPNYSAMPAGQIRDMKDALPNAKYIFIVREPIERAKSSLRMWLTRRKDKFSNDQIISQWSKKMISGYKYSDSIATLDRIFNKESILYLPFGLIKTRPNKFLREVEKFTGVAPFYHYKDPSHKVHATKNIALTEPAISLINNIFAEDIDYIKERFGTNFAEQTR